MADASVLGVLNDMGAKFKYMVLMTSLIAFVNHCIDNKLQPQILELIDWIKDKTGYIIDSKDAEFFLNLLLSNINLFFIFTVSELCEELARQMLDSPSGIIEAMRRFL